MRDILHAQLPIVASQINHVYAEELAEVGRLLDAAPTVVEWVHRDLVRGVKAPNLGRRGLSAEQVLRASVVQRIREFTYEELAFSLADSDTYRSFCRLGFGQAPSRATLQRSISRIQSETWEKINRLLVTEAAPELEPDNRVRIDCTVVASNVHHPTDSGLLVDCVNGLTRQLSQVAELVPFSFSNHRRRAKNLAFKIANRRGMARKRPVYRALLGLVRKLERYAERAIEALCEFATPGILDGAVRLVSDINHLLELTADVVSQTVRRIVNGETVPASEKIVSIFEPHTDIIRKDGRTTYYGHKICLAAGRTLITDCLILDGNPGDSTLAVEMVERQTAIFGKPPEAASFDGGFASKANLEEIREHGVKHAAFAKKCGLTVDDMTDGDHGAYRALRRFRAGVEAVISYLKRGFGLAKCVWKGLANFKSFVWSGIVCANLLSIARHRLAT